MSLQQYRWYHGPVPRSETERLLMGKQQGIYIVRDSSTMRGDFVLSVSENSKVSHYIINNKGNHYKIGEQTFADIPSIINFYKNHFLDTTTLIGAVPREIKVQTLYKFDGRDPDDLPFEKGETLVIINQDEESWWTAENNRGQRGSIPVPYVKVLSDNRPQSLPTPSPQRPISVPLDPGNNRDYQQLLDQENARKSHPNFTMPPEASGPEPSVPPTSGPLLARAKIDRVCSPYDQRQLSFKKGDLIKVLKQNDNGIWEGELNEKVGDFPMSHVNLIDPNTMEPYLNGF